MKKALLCLVILGLSSVVSRGATFDFEDAAVGALPAGWASAMTHDGGPPRWEVAGDVDAASGNKVLAQLSSDATNGRYPLAIVDGARMSDGELSVRFKPLSGAVDQAGGLVWRYRDPDNYYVVRANALEDNVVMYKVEAGKRSSLAPKGTPEGTYGVEYPIPAQQWSELRVVVRGGTHTVYLGGQELFVVEDETFLGSGKAGVWTKADSVTHFDDFTLAAE